MIITLVLTFFVLIFTTTNIIISFISIFCIGIIVTSVITVMYFIGIL